MNDMPNMKVTKETSQKAADITTTTNRKNVTTIFVKKKVEAKKVPIQQEETASMTKQSGTAKVADMPTKVVEATSSDEEFLEATLTLERDEENKAKEKADSDEEFLQAAVALEKLQVTNVKGDQVAVHREGPHHGGDHHGHPHQEEGAKEARRTTDLKLSPGMTKSHPGGTQEWMEGNLKLEGHGEGDLPAGGDYRHVQDQGAEGAEEAQQDGAIGVASSPPSSSTSPTRSQTTPPGSPLTPGTSGARLSCTPLWKKKSLLRMSSSSQGKSKKKRASQPRSPAATPTRSSASKHTMSSTSTYKYMMSPTPEKARPGPELPHKCLISETPLYAQEQLASTSTNPTDVTKPSEWKKM